MNFIKYPKIKRVGSPENKGIFQAGTVVVEEKLDGANFRFGWDSELDKLRFGSRNVELTDRDNYGDFEMAVRTVRAIEKLLEPDYIYFAEYMIPHTIKYDWSKTPTLVGFDVYDTIKCRFLDHEEAKEMFKNIFIEFVPIIDVRDAEEITPDYLDKVIPQSKYYNGLAEGVVFKNYSSQLFAKLIAEQFKEVNRMTFGGSKKQVRTPEEYLLEKYCPPRRIEKIIQKLVHEYNMPLDMSMMKELPKAVFEDIAEEEAKNILRENITVNLQRFRKMVAKRCVNVLQREIAKQEVLKNGV